VKKFGSSDGEREARLRDCDMKIRSMMLLLVCAVALSGCETINGAWHDVFGLNGAPARTASN
jgi:predicted small secreted protein